MPHFLVGVISRQIILCRNFHSKVGVGVILDVGVISVQYGTCTVMYLYTHSSVLAGLQHELVEALQQLTVTEPVHESLARVQVLQHGQRALTREAVSKCGSQSFLKKDGDGAPPDNTGRQLLSVRGVVCDGWWCLTLTL